MTDIRFTGNPRLSTFDPTQVVIPATAVEGGETADGRALGPNTDISMTLQQVYDLLEIKPGPSAYDAALTAGFEGTLEEWLESLQGEQGERGLQGVQGFRGEKGERGEQGIQGVKGDKGDQGVPGDRGLQGVKGDKGDKGEIGERGEKGDNGADGTGIELNGGVDEYQDLPATLGPGDVGASYINRSDNLLYIWDGTKFPMEGAGVEFRGERGERGEQGPRGLPGDKGDRGEKGDQGDRGEQGLQGLQGIKGDTGADGSVLDLTLLPALSSLDAGALLLIQREDGKYQFSSDALQALIRQVAFLGLQAGAGIRLTPQEEGSKIQISAPGAPVIDIATSTTLGLEHVGAFLRCINNTNINITVPLQTTVEWLANTQLEGAQWGTGTVTFTAPTGVNIRRNGKIRAVTDGQYAPWSLKRVGVNEWLLFGQMVAT